MPPIVVKLLPQAIILAVVLYWAWPALTTPAPKALETPAAAKKAAEAPMFPTAMLTPSFESPSPRDPFLRGGERPNKSGKKSKLADKKAKSPLHHNGTNAEDLALDLTATCIVGDHRLALINGRLYREHDVVEKNGDATKCVIAKIEPHQVELLFNGRLVELQYTTPAAKKAATPDSPEQASEKK